MAIMFLVAIDVIGRNIFHHPFPGTYEIVQVLLAFSVFLCLAYAEERGAHIRVDIIADRISLRMRYILDIFASLLALMLFIMIAWQGAIQAGYSLATSEYYPGLLHLPVSPARIVLVIGSSLFSLQVLTNLVKTTRNLIK